MNFEHRSNQERIVGQVYATFDPARLEIVYQYYDTDGNQMHEQRVPYTLETATNTMPIIHVDYGREAEQTLPWYGDFPDYLRDVLYRTNPSRDADTERPLPPPASDEELEALFKEESP